VRLAKIAADDLVGVTELPHLPVHEPDGRAAQGSDGVEAVGDEDDGPALGPELRDALVALDLETLVADRQHLVDEEDLGVYADGHRERQAGVHPARVVLHRHVHELLDPCEVDDLVVAGFDLASSLAEQ
jgi:hypothetical protein